MRREYKRGKKSETFEQFRLATFQPQGKLRPLGDVLFNTTYNTVWGVHYR